MMLCRCKLIELHNNEYIMFPKRKFIVLNQRKCIVLYIC